MDLQQLKSLAERVRALLQQHSSPIGHSQSLDLVAAVPGLRNWPEVVAFPDRVAACDLDDAAARRLAFRLNKKYQVSLSPQAVLAAVDAQATTRPRVPKIWPTGPEPGVYVTTSQTAINALLARYEEATDGEIIYAERAGSHWTGSVDLGESGLWSLDRVPSGTLVVVGPIELDQQSWEEAGKHLEMACLDALVSGHRVAVLLETPTPDAVCEDVFLLVNSTQPEGEDYETALLGVVTEDGHLGKRQPFARSRPRLAVAQTVASLDAIPPSALGHLEQVLKERKSGLLMFGASKFVDHLAIELVAASLALTDHAGPAARIMPRHRSTPAKDWLVPAPIKQLPYLPSIVSAYAQGYRRMVISGNYTDGERMLDVGDDVLFIGGNFGSEVDEIFLNMAVRSHGKEMELLSRLVAVLGVKQISGKRGEAFASDLYVACSAVGLEASAKYDDIKQFLRANRVLRWEEEAAQLLDSGAITVAGLKKARMRNDSVDEFLRQRAKNRGARK